MKIRTNSQNESAQQQANNNGQAMGQHSTTQAEQRGDTQMIEPASSTLMETGKNNQAKRLKLDQNGSRSSNNQVAGLVQQASQRP
jgi:hypothetical protein